MNEHAERLDELVREPDACLDRVLAVVASVDPDGAPTEDEVVTAIDEVADRCPGRGPAEVLADLFGPSGFSANRRDYYDPANSLIHRVLERRRGIPLSLTAVAVEVGRRRGVELHAVGFPGHVLVGSGPVQPGEDLSDTGPWYDPFASGTPLDVDGCRQLLAATNPGLSFDPRMLAPMPAAAVAVRTLNNLRVAYASKGMANRLVPVLELRANLSTGTAGDRLELARLLAGLGRVEQASLEFERLARLDRSRADAHRARAEALRARLN